MALVVEAVSFCNLNTNDLIMQFCVFWWRRLSLGSLLLCCLLSFLVDALQFCRIVSLKVIKKVVLCNPNENAFLSVLVEAPPFLQANMPGKKKSSSRKVNKYVCH